MTFFFLSFFLSRSGATKTTVQQFQDFVGAFDAAMDAAQKGYEAASEVLVWAQYVADPKADKSKKVAYIKVMQEISKAGVERSQNVLSGYQEVEPWMEKVGPWQKHNSTIFLYQRCSLRL